MEKVNHKVREGAGLDLESEVGIEEELEKKVDRKEGVSSSIDELDTSESSEEICLGNDRLDEGSHGPRVWCVVGRGYEAFGSLPGAIDYESFMYTVLSQDPSTVRGVVCLGQGLTVYEAKTLLCLEDLYPRLEVLGSRDIPLSLAKARRAFRDYYFTDIRRVSSLHYQGELHLLRVGGGASECTGLRLDVSEMVNSSVGLLGDVLESELPGSGHVVRLKRFTGREVNGIYPLSIKLDLRVEVERVNGLGIQGEIRSRYYQSGRLCNELEGKVEILSKTLLERQDHRYAESALEEWQELVGV